METTESHKTSSHSSAKEALSIFNYSDFREYLKDFYQLKKTNFVGYSYAVFSQRAGIKSPNYLKLVMDGQRNLSAENILAFAKGLGLGEQETLYWENLVQFGQAKTPRQRQFYLMRMSQSPLPQGTDSTRLIRRIRDEWEYYSSWSHAAIREMVMMPGFDPSPAAIASTLRGRITAEEAQASLALLKRLGFLVEDTQQGGRLVQRETHVRYRSQGDVANIAVRRYHRSVARLASASLEDDSEEAHQERHFNALTIAVNRQSLPLLKERLAQYLRALNVEFSLIPPTLAKDGAPSPIQGEADQVYQLNMQLFPLTDNPDRPAPRGPKKSSKERLS